MDKRERGRREYEEGERGFEREKSRDGLVAQNTFCQFCGKNESEIGGEREKGKEREI